jgi:hypothetical protein
MNREMGAAGHRTGGQGLLKISRLKAWPQSQGTQHGTSFRDPNSSGRPFNPPMNTGGIADSLEKGSSLKCRCLETDDRTVDPQGIRRPDAGGPWRDEH